MDNGKITTDDIGNALINLSENIGICDKQTAIGLKTSKMLDTLGEFQEY